MSMSEILGMRVETPGDTDIVLTRRFNAARQLVWRAYTEPDLVRRWLIGSPGWTMVTCDIDLKVGGGYHYRWQNDADGSSFGFVASFSEIVSFERIVGEERPDDMPDTPPAIVVVEFIALGDMTELRMTLSYVDAATREMVIGTGMTGGVGLSFDMMDDVLAGMRL